MRCELTKKEIEIVGGGENNNKNREMLGTEKVWRIGEFASVVSFLTYCVFLVFKKEKVSIEKKLN